VLGELTHFGLPSILVPYPYAWRYQKVNADVLASRGAAVRIEDEQMANVLLPTISALLDDPAKLAEMQAQAAALAQPDAAGRIAEVLIEVAEGSQQRARQKQKDGRT
jgi:UDP-N-acetylglucosamine--N-acetylmuramyl-(pentapeptide) pyrophosphoryl-undecaprenol N-acetylglucosamine transferase